MSSSIFASAAVAVVLVATQVCGRPQAPGGAAPPQEAPMPYEYNYKVEDPPTSLYFGANEVGNEVGRVDGKYYVLLPDGRTMTVSYYVEGESGFVPTITFEGNANPVGQAPVGATPGR